MISRRNAIKTAFATTLLIPNVQAQQNPLPPTGGGDSPKNFTRNPNNLPVVKMDESLGIDKEFLKYVKFKKGYYLDINCRLDEAEYAHVWIDNRTLSYSGPIKFYDNQEECGVPVLGDDAVAEYYNLGKRYSPSDLEINRYIYADITELISGEVLLHKHERDRIVYGDPIELEFIYLFRKLPNSIVEKTFQLKGWHRA